MTHLISKKATILLEPEIYESHISQEYCQDFFKKFLITVCLTVKRLLPIPLINCIKTFIYDNHKPSVTGKEVGDLNFQCADLLFVKGRRFYMTGLQIL